MCQQLVLVCIAVLVFAVDDSAVQLGTADKDLHQGREEEADELQVEQLLVMEDAEAAQAGAGAGAGGTAEGAPRPPHAAAADARAAGSAGSGRAAGCCSGHAC